MILQTGGCDFWTEGQGACPPAGSGRQSLRLGGGGGQGPPWEKIAPPPPPPKKKLVKFPLNTVFCILDQGAQTSERNCI